MKIYALNPGAITIWDLLGSFWLNPMSASQMFSSCATLEDGRAHIEQNASEVEDEEALLMKELEETNLMF